MTIGYRNGKNPTIEDDVLVTTGAIVLGGIRVGKGAKIGTGAVVIHDVPENAAAVGMPVRMIKTGLAKDQAEDK